MIYCCKSKLSLDDLPFFEVDKLYEGEFDEITNCYWIKPNQGGETPITKPQFKIHFEELNAIRDKKLKQILK